MHDYKHIPHNELTIQPYVPSGVWCVAIIVGFIKKSKSNDWIFFNNSNCLTVSRASKLIECTDYNFKKMMRSRHTHSSGN